MCSVLSFEYHWTYNLFCIFCIYVSEFVCVGWGGRGNEIKTDRDRERERYNDQGHEISENNA